MSYTYEVIHQLWDLNGNRLEIGPDRDGLDLIEFRYYDESQVIESSITIDPDHLSKVIEILQTIQRARPQKIQSGPVLR